MPPAREGTRRPAIARARAAGPRGHGRDRQGPRAALGLRAGPRGRCHREPACCSRRAATSSRGGAPPEDGWRVGIEDPAAADADDAAPLVVVELRSGAVATSSVRVRHWVAPDGRRRPPPRGPATGEPARTGLIAVTVAAADPAWAEVWSKALFLAGRDGIGDEARSRDLAAWWITDEGRLGLTPAARVRTAWAAEDRQG